MARQYEFVFVESGTGDTVDIKAFGNTRSSAERTARGKLRRDHHKDPTRFYTRSTRHIPEHERARSG